MSIRVLNITIIVFIISLISCSQEKNPQFLRLERLAECSSDSAIVALDTLNMFNPDSLSDIDRHYYDFLTIKVSDKSFITHTSDSLILKVIDYAVKHGDKEHYAETLYYGGRVYSDLGDYPRALRYFQQALDELPEKNVKLKATLLSQISWILMTLRLEDEAVPYIHKAIFFDSLLCDSKNIFYDTHILATIYFSQKNYDLAESYFYKARNMARNISERDTSMQDMYLAVIKYHKGVTDSALNLIRPVVDNIRSCDRPTALANAVDIYHEAGIYDTAFVYAKELVNQHDYNKIAGYRALLSSELIDYIPQDSLSRYVNEYRNYIDKYICQNRDEEALLQNSYYNYKIHVREKIKAEKEKMHLLLILGAILIILLLLVIIVLYLRNKNKDTIIKLRHSLDNLEKLRKSIDGESNDSSQYSGIDSYDVQQVREKLKKELFDFFKTNNNQISVAPDILNSAEYRKLELLISEEKVIPESSVIWSDLEEAVIKAYPHFKYRLQLLIGNNPSDGEYRLIILMKFGLTFSQIATLLGRRQSTITYRREKLCQKIFGYKTKLSDVDALIIAL